MMLRRFQQDETGNALVEAAIVLPVMALLLAGGFELARGIAYHHAADKAVRDVARYLARIPTTEANSSTLAETLVKAQISSPDSATITVNSTRLTNDNIVRINCALTYSFPLLKIIWPNPQITFNLVYEQPYIGE